MSESQEVKEMGKNRYDLPEGWVWATLGEICEKPQYGWTTSADFNGKGIKLLRTTDISSGSIKWDKVPFCKHIPENPQKYFLKKGDILVSRAGSVGISIEIEDCPKAIFASYLIRFKPIPPIPSKFVSLYLKSPYYWDSIADNTAGIAIPNVNATKLRSLKIPLPPLNEIIRIIIKVEELLNRINEIKKQFKSASSILGFEIKEAGGDKVTQLILAKAFRGELVEQDPNDEPAKVLLCRLKERKSRW
jgi:type I restriction enzyme S subunit